MSGNRLLTASLVLGALLALTVWQWNARQSEYTRPPELSAKLPKLAKDAVDELEIAAPNKPPVKLEKHGKSWKLSAPLTAAADQNAVDTALTKLSELAVVGMAATKADNHKKLEVDDAKGLHVVAKQGGKVLLDLVLGAYRSGNTMVREKSSSVVVSVTGSIKFAFDKELKDWRERTVSEVDPEHVHDILFQNTHGAFHFVREGTDWKQAPGEKAIANFDGSLVKSLVASAARLSAVDFAPADTARDAAGIGAVPEGTVSFTPSGDAGTQQVVLRIGKKLDTNYYLGRDGNDTIYLVSAFVAERLLPSAEKFAKAEPKPAAAVPGTPGKPGTPVAKSVTPHR